MRPKGLYPGALVYMIVEESQVNLIDCQQKAFG